MQIPMIRLLSIPRKPFTNKKRGCLTQLVRQPHSFFCILCVTCFWGMHIGNIGILCLYRSFAPNFSSKVFCRRVMILSICLSLSVLSGSCRMNDSA